MIRETQEKEVTLTHRKTGERKTFVLRGFRFGDEDAVAQCVREEYGDTYYRREYYDRKLLRRQLKQGRLHLFLAWCGDDVCGMQTLVPHPPETRIEAASQIFRREYSGYGLPFELVKHTYAIARTLHPSCIYAPTVIFHSITQRMCEEAGMVPVAFNFGSHLTAGMKNRFHLGGSEKYGQAILVLPVDRHDVGMVYIHPDIAKPVERLYRNLGVDYQMITETEAESGPDAAASELAMAVNDREQSVSISVNVIGTDLMERVGEILTSHSGKYWTFRLILPVDRRSALSAYEQLTSAGFFFTGIRPLCAKSEQIFLQYTGDVRFNFDEFKLSDSFQRLLQDVLKYYRESK